MVSRRRKRMNVEDDRLSSLPDDLIHKILSYVSIKLAVETSVLSSRWRYIWTSMPCLNFSSKDFHTLPKFSKFVKHVLSGRNNQIEVSSVELTSSGKVIQPYVKGILDYAFAHNVQQMNITCLPEKEIELPLSLFSSQSLKDLTLTGCTRELSIMTPPTWELQALATLNLHSVSLDGNNTDKCAGIFSHCANLKNLTLKSCIMKNGFDICHPRLSNLTLEDRHWSGYEVCNVVTPQLKSLTVRRCRKIHLISAPNLSNLHYKDDYHSLQLPDDLLHLEKVDICVSRPYNADEFVCLLQQLRSVKNLTLNLEIVELISSSMELILHQPSPFVNLKNLRVYPDRVTLETEEQTPVVTMSTEAKNFLLDSSSGATFTLVSYEEVRTARNVALAQSLMRELQVLLDQWKENCETNTARKKQDTTPMEKIMAKAHELALERMTHIDEQFKKGHKNTGRTMSMLRKIKKVLTRLPTSQQAKLQVRYFNLCADAETFMDNMVDHLKIQCDKKPRLCFHELATASQPSS